MKQRLAILLTVLWLGLLASCGPNPAEVEATVSAVVATTFADYAPATATPYPTDTPYPTATSYLTATPYATATSYPTQEPYPTATPYPTRTLESTETAENQS
ncbi:MAG: hypothetical protein L0332_01285 [Chloroflexi bacterium]|nr:hypothetical protein [Chloroflexota bacterium]MCI0577427.1 hypothetical protein [Chloroflexota bacterium]MCI0649483.1 hypothetical protein [Chloroflexota bacterium]MCI0725355.1 hypothetical protein [Chloroflexota bacterium]